MRKWMVGVMVSIGILLAGTAAAASSDSLKASYRTPEGIQFVSYSEVWNEDKLIDLYRLLLQCAHGEEFNQLKTVALYPAKSVGVSGYRSGQYDPATKEISLYEVDNVPIERTLVHEYGHHFTYYWLNRKEGLEPRKLSADSDWAKVRQLDGYPVRWKTSLLPYNRRWDPSEIMAEDYVLLFGHGLHALLPPSESIANMARHENDYIPPAVGLPLLRKYWTSAAGLEEEQALAVPEVVSVERQFDAEQLGSTYKINFKSAATYGEQLVKYAVILNRYNENGVHMGRTIANLSVNGTGSVDCELRFPELTIDEAGGTRLEVQLWAYDREQKQLIYTPFYENWMRYTGAAVYEPSLPPLKAQGIQELLKKEGMERWPNMQLFLNGRPFRMEGRPVIRDNAVYVPIGAMAAKLGFTLNKDEGRYKLVRGQKSISLESGVDYILSNGLRQPLKKRTRTEDKTIYVCAEDAANLFELTVSESADDGGLLFVTK